jgi:hypothetical protein
MQGDPSKLSLRTLVTESSQARNNPMSFHDRPHGRTPDTGLAAAPDTGPAARRLPLGAVNPVDRGHARVRAGDAR